MYITMVVFLRIIFNYVLCKPFQYLDSLMLHLVNTYILKNITILHPCTLHITQNYHDVELKIMVVSQIFGYVLGYKSSL